MAFRAYFALPVDKFSTSTGQHTNAVHGFVSMLANLIKNEQPTHVAVAFDAGSTTFRTERFPDYKGGRESTPEPFKGQVPLIREVLDAMRITHFERDMIEADDILATLRAFGLEADFPAVAQSAREPLYRDALDRLRAAGLAYPCRCSRSDSASACAAAWLSYTPKYWLSSPNAWRKRRR